MGGTLDKAAGRPTIKLSQLAVLKLKLLLQDEPDADRLCYQVVPTTTGCGSSSFHVTLTEKQDEEHLMIIEDIPFSYREADRPFLDGLTIELNRKSGKLELSNPFFHTDTGDCCTNNH